MPGCDTTIENNRVRFFHLARKLDNMLLNFSHDIHVICNPSIHLPRNHPEYLGMWKSILYKKSPSITDKIYLLFMLFYALFFGFTKIFLELFHYRRNLEPFLNSKDMYDYLFVSHYLGKELCEADSYYGQIIDNLSVKGVKVARLMVPHVKFIENNQIKSHYQTLILNNSIDNISLLKYFINNLYSILKIARYCKIKDFLFFETIIIIIGQVNNFYNFKIAYNLELFLSTHNVKNIIMTYEGNAIEKSVFFMSHKYNVTCGGYQHAPIIMDQHAIFTSIESRLDPDFILCSGAYTYNKFKSSLGSKILIRNLGSPKFFESKSNNLYTKTKETGILLVPDGNRNSIKAFLSLGLYLCLRNSELNVLIRSHPLFEDFLNERYSLLKSKPSSFLISNNKISIDLSEAQWVIYQNSAVSIQALQFNCKVLYFAHPLANVDPLFDLTFNHYVSKSSTEILDIVSKDRQHTYNEEKLARIFAQNYFSRLNYSAL